MIRALLVASLALVPLVPVAAGAQDRVSTAMRYDPAPLWYFGPASAFGAQNGRIRIVSGGGVSAALDLDQYWAYERVYREAMGHHASRMSVARADRLARKDALDAIFALYPGRQATAFRVAPVGGTMPAPIRPGG